MAGPEAPFPDTAELERAVHLLLDVLPPYMQGPVREMAYVYARQPMWAFIAGHLLAAYEHGTLSAPIHEPSWLPHFGQVGVDLSTVSYKCAECGLPFTPTRFKQQYCSEACGTAAVVAQAARERLAAASR